MATVNAQPPASIAARPTGGERHPQAQLVKPKKGRVLLMLENSPYPDDTRVRHESRTLADAGYEVTVICQARRGQARRETVQGVRVYRYPAPPNATGFLGYIIEYGWAMLAGFVLSLYVAVRHGFDILHATNPPDTYVFLGAFYKLFGKKFVFDHHDLSPELYQARFGPGGKARIVAVLRLLERWSCRLADRILATNESVKAVEIERGGVPASRITVVRNGPKLDRFRPVDPAPEIRARARHVLCYCGVINGPDGVEYLLRAVAHLAGPMRRNDFVCVIMGDGDALPGLRALAAELDIERHLLFTGYIADRERLVRYLATADICVAPEPSNAYNDRSTIVKVMEYMAMAKPIVAFDLPEHRRSAGEAAIYVPGNDIAAFAMAVARLMDHPFRRRMMGAIARRRVETELSWSHSSRHLLEAYEQVMASRERGGALRRWRAWFAKRPLLYTATRALRLLRRYGWRPEKAMDRVIRCVRMLAEYGCRPTFPVPGRVMDGSPRFFRELQQAGAELAVHGYDHVDFRHLSDDESAAQLARAGRAFSAAGVEIAGMRCPYLSATPKLIASLDPQQFRYSSNDAICWKPVEGDLSRDPTFRTLSGFYHPQDCETTLALPRLAGRVLELPAATPDDLQLYDGLHLRGAELADAWIEVVRRIHARGELCVLLFHPELFDELRDLFKSVLREARGMEPAVWLAPLREVAEWWNEKAGFSAQTSRRNNAVTIEFRCSPRATVLARNVDLVAGTTSPWTGNYRRVTSRSVVSRGERLPFLGVGPDISEATVTLLRDQGYIVVGGQDADYCATFLDAATAAACANEVQLIETIESGDSPLVRFWRWPDGAKSALCFTGDLDAVSLRDYAVRLFT